MNDLLSLPPDVHPTKGSYDRSLKHFRWNFRGTPGNDGLAVSVFSIGNQGGDHIGSPPAMRFENFAEAVFAVSVIEWAMDQPNLAESTELLSRNGFTYNARGVWVGEFPAGTISCSFLGNGPTLSRHGTFGDRRIATVGSINGGLAGESISTIVLLNLLQRRMMTGGSIAAALSQATIEALAEAKFMPSLQPLGPSKTSKTEQKATASGILFERAATTSLEIAHRGVDDVPHGHSLLLEVWTGKDTCLDAWQARITAETRFIGRGFLEDTISGRTFEDVAATVLGAVPEASRVVVRLPSLGHAIEARRG